MSMLKMPDGLTKSQKRRVDKYSKTAKKGPKPSGKMPKGMTTRKKKRKRKKR